MSFSFLKKNTSNFLGALIDDRPQNEKEKDYMTVEAYAKASPVKWVEKNEASWRKFVEQDQSSSSSCVAHTMRKIMGVMHYVNEGSYIDFSATQVYKNRTNFPGEGMNGVDVFEIVKDKGITLEVLVPSDNKKEDELNYAKIKPYEEEIAKIFRISGHIGIAGVGDIDQVASVIQETGKAVMVWFYFTSAEWSPFVPVVKDNLMGATDPRAYRHSVSAVDFTLYKGKKALIIEDSAHFGGRSQRVVTEDYFRARNFFGRYPMNFKFNESGSGNKPKYTFSQSLNFIPLNNQGRISNPSLNSRQENDVKALQDILKYEGVMPNNIESTGYYGSITSKAVYNYQVKYQVDTPTELKALQGRTVGPKTIKKLNEFYG